MGYRPLSVVAAWAMASIALAYGCSGGSDTAPGPTGTGTTSAEGGSGAGGSGADAGAGGVAAGGGDAGASAGGAGGQGQGGQGQGGQAQGGQAQGGQGQGGQGQGGQGQGGQGQGGQGQGGQGQGGGAVACNLCHGSAANAAPPLDTATNTATSAPGVGAHQSHILPSNWHLQVACEECHIVPAVFFDPNVPTHINGVDDVIWGPLAAQGTYDKAALTCSGVYCHGGTLGPDGNGPPSNRTPHWTTVDGSQKACGASCHTLPPGGGHPNNSSCEQCHGDVVASFDAANPANTSWANADLHIDGQVEITGNLTCTTCHGNANTGDPSPPLGTSGETQTSQAAVGAHQQHLAPGSGWHRNGQCADCHALPGSPLHSNGVTELTWGLPANADGAQPTYQVDLACAGAYCHGATLLPDGNGGPTNRTPVWTTVDGSQKVCGQACHTLPPGGGHPNSTSCPSCHGDVIASFDVAQPGSSLWTNAGLHVDGVVQVANLTCTSCHGNANTGNPAPPVGTNGETQTNQAAVGAHQQHLAPASGWHRDGQCIDCHAVPASTLHSNGATDFSWGAVSTADGAQPAFLGNLTCTGAYCHGTTLLGPKPNGVVSRVPVWTTVNGTYDSCGNTCHTNPPGAPHAQGDGCALCHAEVVAAYDPVNTSATWTDAAKHVDGLVQSADYHDLPAWLAPKGNANHHGSHYFIANQQQDEHGIACTSCHGANLDGGWSGISCNNAACHGGGDWKACTFCHGTPPNQNNPPFGVADEIATNTLAVGRHVAHLTASQTHVAFACATCHAVPPAADVAHALGYVPSASLQTPGHHGDILFSAPAVGMTWNVAATQGNPVSARGTCVQSCHSNGAGGPPVVVPYWAGGAWNVGSCGSCHPASPNTGEHQKHAGKGIGCLVCHDAASSSTHLNGVQDVKAVIVDNGTVTTTQPPNACNPATVSCQGNCHGKNHNPECW